MCPSSVRVRFAPPNLCEQTAQNSPRARMGLERKTTVTANLPRQTRKLSAKGAQGFASSTRGLAEFFRSSESPYSTSPSSGDSRRSRAASTNASVETYGTSGSQTTGSRIRNALGRATSPAQQQRFPKNLVVDHVLARATRTQRYGNPVLRLLQEEIQRSKCSKVFPLRLLLHAFIALPLRPL